MQIQEAKGLSNNPLVPANCCVCFINNLPLELLSRIFEFGTRGNGKAEDCWHFICPLDPNRADGGHVHHNDVVVVEESGDENESEEGDDEDETEYDGHSDATSPFELGPPFQILVTHVCHLWRTVAFSTPSLWTTFCPTPTAGLSLDPGLTLLERSKNHPIDVWISCDICGDFDTKTPSDDDLRSLLSMFIPHAHRWRTVIIEVPTYHHAYEFLSALSGASISSAPRLTLLELSYNSAAEEFDSVDYPSISKHLTLFGGSAPLLTTVILLGVPVDWTQPWISSAPNLKLLELRFHAEDVRPSWTRFATILSGAPALVKLALHDSGPSGEPVEWFIEPTPESPANLNAPIQLPQLESLILAHCSPERAIGLLQRLHIPALTGLLLDFDEGDYTDFVYELARPSPALSLDQEQPRSLLSGLESLELNGLPCSPECAEILYRDLENVERLGLWLYFLPSSFLDVLGTPCTLPGRANVWLPRLCSLELWCVPGDALLRLVQMRKDAGAPLKVMWVESSTEVDEEDKKWLKENLDQFWLSDGSR